MIQEFNRERGKSFIFQSSESGWGTWIRTRTKRVRAARSTVKLFPTGEGAGMLAGGA